MKDPRSTVRALAAAKRGDFHPSPEDLLSYQAGDLDRQAAERVLRHLAACSQCTRTVLDLESFPEVEPVDADRAVSSSDVAERWSRFEERLQREPERGRHRVAEEKPLGFFARLTRPWHSLAFTRAVATALLMATVVLSWTLLERLPQPVDGSPRINLALTELAPSEDSGQRGQAPAVRLPAGTSGVLLTLALLDPRTFPAYAIDMVSEATGDIVWHRDDLQRNPEGIFTVQLPREFLPAGSYRIDLRGVDEESEQPLASYRVELVLE